MVLNGEMFEGDIADKCAKNFFLCQWVDERPCQACADAMRAKTPIGASELFVLEIIVAEF